MTDTRTRVRLLGGFWADVRQGVRSLGKSPGLTTVALLTLALGIGANAAMFSVVNAVLLRPLPFAQPERLVSFWGSNPKMGLEVFHYPEALIVHFRTRSRTFESIGSYSGAGFTLTGNGEPLSYPVAVGKPGNKWIGERSIDVLRQELSALNRPRLLTIISAYSLAGDIDLTRMSDAQLVGVIVAAVERTQSPRSR